MTLKSRLATAAAAMVQRITTLRRLLMLRPESPFRKGLIGLGDDIMADFAPTHSRKHKEIQLEKPVMRLDS